ncbi:MAG TPA: GNAT family N-acetyltransferase [Acidimicrobiales bacterium]|nr:GNAT family N-acetyltransferase [Acidimicrobiales bacterium]
MTEGFVVEAVAPERLHDLRRRVLRRDDPAARVAEPRDDEPTALHLAGVLDGEVVVCASFYLAPYPIDPGRVDYQLRFMATDEGQRGRGLGAVVLAAGEAEVVARGARRVWANARDTALGFYERTGWRVVPDSALVSEETGLPHHVIVKDLAGD